MFCVVYEFKVKEGANLEFESAWADFTEAIFRVCGSLGSRLHKTDNPQIYIAYAQWPSREIFYRDLPQESYTPKEWSRREAMRASLIIPPNKVYELDLFDDHLRHHSIKPN